jgi:hypothetical protein
MYDACAVEQRKNDYTDKHTEMVALGVKHTRRVARCV